MPAYERIVSLAPSNTEILYALGAEDRVVATTAICDHPEAAQEKPSIGGWTNADADQVAAHDPDLVLASDELQDEAVDACRDAGLTVEQFTPTKLHDVFNTIKRVGELVDAEDAALELVEEMNATLRKLAVTEKRSSQPRVYCEEWHEPPMVSGNWVPRIADMLGAEYLTAEGERSREVDLKEIRIFDPTHIFLHPCGYGDAADPSTLSGRDGWDTVSAVQNDNVYVIDDSLLNRPGPRLVDGMQEMKERIHRGQ